MLFLLSAYNSQGQNLTKQDLLLIAKEVNAELQGKDIGNGISLRNCLATERALIYSYNVPDSWLPPSSIKEDLIENFQTSGIMDFYKANGIDLEFFYYNDNKLIKTVEISNSHSTFSNYELGSYINLDGHPKGKDVNIKLKPPVDWKILEGDRPNILKKFVDESNMFLILIKENSTFFSRNESRELLSDEDYTEDFFSESGRIFTSYEIYNKRIITIDTYPTLEYMISGTTERSGITLEMVMKIWIIFYEDKMIHLQASGLDRFSFEQREPLYTSIINSVIFPDQYNY